VLSGVPLASDLLRGQAGAATSLGPALKQLLLSPSLPPGSQTQTIHKGTPFTQKGNKPPKPPQRHNTKTHATTKHHLLCRELGRTAGVWFADVRWVYPFGHHARATSEIPERFFRTPSFPALLAEEGGGGPAAVRWICPFGATLLELPPRLFGGLLNAPSR